MQNRNTMASPSSRRRSVLLVDDDELFADATAEILRGRGFEVEDSTGRLRITDVLLTRTDGASFTLVSIENAQLTGGASANTFTVSGWTRTAALDGAAVGAEPLAAITGAAEAKLDSAASAEGEAVSGRRQEAPCRRFLDTEPGS